MLRGQKSAKNPTSWKRRSASKRGLVVLTVTGVLLCLARVVCKAETLNDRQPLKNLQIVPNRAGNETMCLSPELINIASTVLKNMNPDVDPCDDFYRFACGRFLSSTFIPDQKNYVNFFSRTKDKLQQQLRTIMEEPIKPNEQRPFRLVKNLYKSCINKTAIEDQGLKALYRILKKLGGWPVLDGDLWNEADFDWINSIYKFRDAGYSTGYFFRLGIKIDWKNQTRNVLTLDTADLGLSYEYLSKGVDNKNVMAYYSYMVDVAYILGAERERASTELMESLLFEINLANISFPLETHFVSMSSHTRMSLDELQDNYPSIPWKEYFSKLLPKNITAEENEVTIVYKPSFISDLEKLLIKTPKRVQANYVIWKAVKASVRYLNDDIRKREFAYLTALNGKTLIKSRWQECVDHISDHLPIAVGAMYVRKYSNEKTKQYVLDIVTNIKKQYYKILQQVKWMDDNMRQTMIKSVAAISSYVAYHNELLDDTKVEKIYENLELSGGNYLDSMLNVTLFNIEFSFGTLRKLVNRNDWITHARPAVVTVLYKPFSNSIHFPAGILQDPFFSIDRPRYMNYGNIGFLIGHEIAHSFAYIVRDISKNVNPSIWLPAQRNYLKRVECIIQQYENYTVEDVGLKLNGMQTKYDDIADNAGIKAAYLAYISWAEKNQPELKLPGLQYSPNQMFWISAANQWCTKYRSEAMKYYISTNKHSPPEFRVLGPISNMPEFSKDFSCPTGSKMNPEKKCSVW